jgi:glycine/D-amino acid oxidase-like deaminating enzyme
MLLHGDGVHDNFHGFPIPADGDGLKVGREQYHVALADPDDVDRRVPPAEERAMFETHVAGRFAGLSDRPLRGKTCLYTMTDDGDFLVSRAPDNDRLLHGNLNHLTVDRAEGESTPYAAASDGTRVSRPAVRTVLRPEALAS